jgi:hypothetical protein
MCAGMTGYLAGSWFPQNGQCNCLTPQYDPVVTVPGPGLVTFLVGQC